MTTSVQKASLIAQAQSLLDLANALAIDGDTVALEAQLNATYTQLASVQSQLDATTALRNGLQNKVDAAVLGLDSVRAGLVA